MKAARAAAAASPTLPPLKWTRDGSDGLSDLRLTLANETFHVHVAVIAAGVWPRRA